MTMRGASLRTKGGCQRCRAFRKKCDEQKPACSRCCRASRSCIWPTGEQMTDRRRRKIAAAEVSVPGTPPTAQSRAPTFAADDCEIQPSPGTPSDTGPLFLSPRPKSTISSDIELNLLQYFTDVYYERLLLPRAYPQFHDITGRVMHLALHQISMMQVAVASAALHIYHTSGSAVHHQLALSFYGRGLHSLSQTVLRKDELSDDDGHALGFTMSFLFIFAASSDDCFNDVPCHVAAAQQYIRRRYLDRGVKLPMQPMDEVLLESVLYQTFDLAAKRHTPAGSCADDEFFATTIDILKELECQSREKATSSPVLGIELDLHHLVFRIAQFRNASVDLLARETFETKAKELLDETQSWEDRHGWCPEGSAGNNKGDIYDVISLLYTLAASVLLRRTILASLAHDMPGDIRTRGQSSIDLRVRGAARLIDGADKDDPSFNCYLGTWALQVLGSASRPCDESRRVIRAELERREDTQRSGDIRRAIRVIDNGHDWF